VTLILEVSVVENLEASLAPMFTKNSLKWLEIFSFSLITVPLFKVISLILDVHWLGINSFIFFQSFFGSLLEFSTSFSLHAFQFKFTVSLFTKLRLHLKSDQIPFPNGMQ